MRGKLQIDTLKIIILLRNLYATKKSLINLTIKGKLILLLVIAIGALLGFGTLTYVQTSRLSDLHNEGRSRDEDIQRVINAKFGLNTLYSIAADSLDAEAIVGNEEYVTTSKDTIQFSIIISLVISVILVIFMMMIIISIVKPIDAVTSVINRQARLDFSSNENSKITKYLDKSDEIGKMTRSLNVMEENIRDFIMRTSDASEQVAAASEELTATSQHSATGSEEVAKTIEEIANFSENMANVAEELRSLILKFTV